MAVIANTSVHLPVSAIVSALSLILCGYLRLTRKTKDETSFQQEEFGSRLTFMLFQDQ